MTLRNYILYSSVLCAFSGALVWKAVVDIRAFYGIVLLNLFLFASSGALRVSRTLLVFNAYLIASGAVGIWQGTDTATAFLKQFLGISIIAFYYYNFFRQSDVTVETVFRIYARVALWVTVVGIGIVFVQVGVLHQFERMHSVLSEPAEYARIVLPAFYYYADRWLSGRGCGRQTLVMLTGLVLSVSSLGYVGLLLAFYLLATRYRYCTLLAPAVLLIAAIGIYQMSPQVRMRVDDTVRAAAQQSLEGTNLSTYALMSNVFITREVFREHPVFGNGLGSHGLSHERYVGSLEGAEQFIETMYGDLNAEDAASLLLRVISELGAFGVCLLIVFLVRMHVRGGGEHAQISNALLLYLTQKLMRGGHYFSPEMYLFVFLFCFNAFEPQSARHARVSPELEPSASI